MSATEMDISPAGPATDGGPTLIVCAFSSERLERAVTCVEAVLAQRPRPAQVIVVVDPHNGLRMKLSNDATVVGAGGHAVPAWEGEQPAEVTQHVPSERGRPRYLLRRCHHEGISKARLRRLGDASSPRTERAYLRRTLPPRRRRRLWAVVVGPGRAGALGQVGAVIVGVGAAGTGYLVQSVALPKRDSPLERSRDAPTRPRSPSDRRCSTTGRAG